MSIYEEREGIFLCFTYKLIALCFDFLKTQLLGLV